MLSLLSNFVSYQDSLSVGRYLVFSLIIFQGFPKEVTFSYVQFTVYLQLIVSLS